MALVNSSFTVNVTPGAMPPVVHVSEYDIGRTYTVTINGQNGSAFNIPTGTTATVEGTLNGAIGFTTNATISGSTVSFTLTESMTAKSGKAWCKIKLTQNSQPIQTCAFVLAVDRAGVEAETVIGADGFDTQIQNAVDAWIEQNPPDYGIDPTLSISGAAADAKATGDKIGDLKRAFDGIIVESENLFNPDLAREKVGYWVNSTTGEPHYDGDNTYCISDYIRLDGVSPYTVLVASRVWLYDAGKGYLRSISSSPIAIPAGTSYVIVGCKVATVNNTTVAKGENVTAPIPYEAPYVNPDAVKVDSTLTEEGMPADAKTVGDKFDDVYDTLENINSVVKNSPLNKRAAAYFGTVPIAYYSGLLTDYSADAFGRNTDYQTLINKFDSLVDGYYATKVDRGASSDGTNHLFEYDFAPPASTLTNKEKALPTILVISGLHGFEKASVYGLYYFLKDLKENWTRNPILDYLRNHVLLKIIPCCNPYGFNNNTYWNANGVNLNRNFATSGWSLSGEPFTSQYSGPTANSENETKTVSAFIEENTNAIIFVDFHTNGQYSVSDFNKVNWFDFANLPDAFFKEFEYLACSHVETITAHFNEEYSLGLTSQLCGSVTSGLYGSTPTSDIYALEHGILGHTVEGFTGFPNRQGFSAEALKGNSEIIGNWIGEVVNKCGNLL